MAKRVKKCSPQELIAAIDEKCRDLHLRLHGLTLREKVRKLVEISSISRSLGVSVVTSEWPDASSALARIRCYLQSHTGVVIDGVELSVVSGISEYARRVRQLRVEEGFRIVTGASADRDSGVVLKPDQYLLIDASPDLDAARRWCVANRIRKTTGGGAKARILEFLQANVMNVVTTEELAYVAKGKREFGRRIRELRTEDGFAIATRMTGRPDLRSGEYILLSAERQAEPHDRKIPFDVQLAVYKRDNNQCQNPLCGWTMNATSDPRILELHHLMHHAKGGANTVDNLILLCSRCHDEVHAGRLTLPGRNDGSVLGSRNRPYDAGAGGNASYLGLVGEDGRDGDFPNVV